MVTCVSLRQGLVPVAVSRDIPVNIVLMVGYYILHAINVLEIY